MTAGRGALKQRYGGVLRRHGVPCCRLQADGQRPPLALLGEVMLQDVELRRTRVHHGPRGVTRDRLGGRIAFSRIWRTRENYIENI